MRFRKFITEAIVNEPRDWGMYAKKLKKTIDYYGELILKLEVLDTREDDHAQNIIEAAIDRDFYYDNNLAWNPFSHTFNNRGGFNSWENYVSGEASKESFQWTLKFLKLVKEDFEEWKAQANLTDIGEVFDPALYNDTFGNVWKANERDLADGYELEYTEERFKEVVAACHGLHEIVTKFPKWIEDVESKLGATFKRIGDHTGKYRPDHDKVEILYHATPNMSYLLKHGFTKERPDNVIGLGELGGGKQNGSVSVTHDLHIAKEIMRVLKEAHMIANGELDYKEILKWSERDGVKFDELKHEYMRKTKDNTWPPQTPTQVFQIYNYWLWINKKQYRTNPVFGDSSGEELMKNLKGTDAKDIGVVAVEVDLSDEDIEYKDAEKEFRVQPDHIISVKKAM